MAQTRKQKVLEQVQRKRRQRTVLSFTIVAVLVVIIVVAVIFLPRSTNPVSLPDYLSHCVTGSLVYHSHPNLVVTINGVGQTLPISFNPGCPQPIHTHTQDGVLHVETDQNMNYTIGDWFSLWGYYASSPSIATFNSTQVFGYKTGPGHTLTMTLNGNPDQNPGDFRDRNPANFQNLYLPHDAQSGANSCYPTPPSGCISWNIVVTYS